MRTRDLIDLVLLAAIWGASFLFMRVAAPEFGPVAMAAVRVAVAAIVLLPVLVLGGQGGSLIRHWRPLALVGVVNSALPFVLFGYAALVISAGLASVFNAATPLFGALIAWLWLREPLTRWRMLGLVVGMAGVLGLAWHRAGGALGAQPGAGDLAAAGAVLACLLATLLYGFSVNFARQRLVGVPAIDAPMVLGCLVIVIGTSLVVGLWPRRA